MVLEQQEDPGADGFPDSGPDAFPDPGTYAFSDLGASDGRRPAVRAAEEGGNLLLLFLREELVLGLLHRGRAWLLLRRVLRELLQRLRRQRRQLGLVPCQVGFPAHCTTLGVLGDAPCSTRLQRTTKAPSYFL